MWGKERELSEFLPLVKKELKNVVMYASLIAGSCDRHSTCRHYWSLIKGCGKTYENAVSIADSLSHGTLEKICGRICEANPVRFEKKGNLSRLVFDSLLPIRYFYRNEELHLKHAFHEPIRTALDNALKEGLLKHYEVKVVLCFIHHYAEGDAYVDHHEFEIKPVIDTIKQFLIDDDSPDRLAYYSKGIADDRTYTEIIMVPSGEFPDFIKQYVNLKPAPEMQRQEDFGLRQTVNDFSDKILKCAKGMSEAISNDNQDDAANFCGDMIMLSGQLLAFSKTSAYRHGVGDYDVMEENELVSAGDVVFSAEESGILIRLPKLISRVVGGASKRKSIKRILVSDFDFIREHRECLRKSVTISFIHHFYNDRNLIDHDNFATASYAYAIRKVLYGSRRVPIDYYMDSIMEDGDGVSYTEIIVSENDKLSNISKEYGRRKVITT